MFMFNKAQGIAVAFAAALKTKTTPKQNPKNTHTKKVKRL